MSITNSNLNCSLQIKTAVMASNGYFGYHILKEFPNNVVERFRATVDGVTTWITVTCVEFQKCFITTHQSRMEVEEITLPSMLYNNGKSLAQGSLGSQLIEQQ